MIDEIFHEAVQDSETESSAQAPKHNGNHVPTGRVSPEGDPHVHQSDSDRARRRHARRNRPRPQEQFDSPEEVEHATEARELEEALIDVLSEHGARPDKVAPTRDYSGHVRLDFKAAWALVDMADELADLKAPKENS